MIHGEKEYLPDFAGYYRCPNPCSNPNYPKPKWKSDKGFAKHLDGCIAKEYVAPAAVGPEHFADCPDCGQEILKLTSCWKMHRKTVCIDCHEPYLEAGIGFHGPADWEPPGITLEG